jgi:simple sugar transport system ATP-binding protein
VKAVADRVTVLRRGRSVATVPAAEATPRSLAALMVGREVEIGRVEGDGREAGEPVLELEGLAAHGDRGTPALREVSLSVRAGEILAIAGVAGNGQRELAETITGMRPATEGRVRVRGRRLRSGDPRQAIRAGIAYVPEDRLGTGVAPGLTIASNVVLKSYREPEVSRGPLLLLGRIRELADRVMRRYDVRAPGPHVPAWQLSGGNLQKVVLAREFSGAPAVLVAAAPTRGLDVAGIETVHAYLREAAAAGVGVLLISEDLDEILALADRIAVMYEGAIVGERDAKTATVEELGLLMAGGEGVDE